MSVTARTKVCMVIGDPVEDSLSPQLHNAGYHALQIQDQLVYVASRIKAENLAAFIKAVKAMGLVGVSCKTPHKIAVMKYLDEIDPIAQKIGAVNTIVNKNGRLKGYNTDWLGIVQPLQKLTPLRNKKVALLGAGGAARAAAFGLTEKGANLTIYNRTTKKAQDLANELGVKAKSLDASDELKQADIIVNATSVGSPPNTQSSPIPVNIIQEKQIVFDAVAVPYNTALLRGATQQGATVVHGIEMLLYQGMAQFELYTGRPAPEAVMREALIKSLNIDTDDYEV